jgi:hypothetical protein
MRGEEFCLIEVSMARLSFGLLAISLLSATMVSAAGGKDEKTVGGAAAASPTSAERTFDWAKAVSGELAEVAAGLDDPRHSGGHTFGDPTFGDTVVHVDSPNAGGAAAGAASDPSANNAAIKKRCNNSYLWHKQRGKLI